jgi:nucleoid-associated protein YgaU
MKILLNLFVVVLCITSLLTGCARLPSRDQPLPSAETLSPQTAEVTATIEAVPSTTNVPPTSPASRKAISPPGGQSIKLRLSYTVSEGELLWTIAKRPDVYGDPLLWPLLYQANRDQIKDPRKIYVGQTLTIPRNVSEEERENARNLSKKTGFFSPE